MERNKQEKLPSEKNDWKKLVKNNPKSALNAFYVEKWIHILPLFQNTN